MAVRAVFTSSLLVLTFCTGRGDGQWKKRDREVLYHDIDVFKKMAEKIDREIEAFYEDYPDEKIKGDDIEKIQQEHIKNVLDHKTGTRNLLDRKETARKFVFTANTTSEIHKKLPNTKDVTQSQPVYAKLRNNVASGLSSSWPKFEDMLLEMGKRYDWKNDRWIKVKRKPKNLVNDNIFKDNSVSLHEKHKFSYRTVKLNRKSRRNVVIAVTAVR